MAVEGGPEASPPDRDDQARTAAAGEQADRELDLAACEICRDIPDSAWLLTVPGRDITEGGYPPAYARLILLAELSDRLSILQCPNCGRLYKDEFDYTYLAGGTEDEYRLTRIDLQQALELLKSGGARGLTRSAGKWIVM